MEQHIQQEAPGFFSEPPVSEIPAQQIKKLKARCRQEARTFWYDWRAKLESATTNSLNGVMAGIEKDLEASEQHGEELDNLKKAKADQLTDAKLNNEFVSRGFTELQAMLESGFHQLEKFYAESGGGAAAPLLGGGGGKQGEGAAAKAIAAAQQQHGRAAGTNGGRDWQRGEWVVRV